ncbi:MAG TPA: prepilin-type N-terminal cleavage/methylation domain-containing protein [Candidatus Saccharimonadales bacterium]|nr:prepilin-type N-terminal cleavage/methylation domain-containing protein [Candidatus Saccharimonadales bacterium]
MLNRIKIPRRKETTKGFTIIEVMIVLAIAGLILLIVFLAIPALQRNARNTQRKSDVSAMLAAMNNFTNNNNGSLATSAGYETADTKTAVYYCKGATPSVGTTLDHDITYAAGNCPTTATNSEQAKIGIYDLTNAANVWMANAAAPPTVVLSSAATTATNISINSIVINVGYSCGSPASANGILQPRAISIYYVTEVKGNNLGNLQCVES